jgi:immunity protein 10 of polymorphic toxin system
MIILIVDVMAAEEDKELGVYSVNFGGIQTGDEWLISVQLPLNVSEQDVSLGHDTYAITASTGATHYGGVLAWGFWSGGVFLDLDDEAAEALGLENRVNFQLPEARHVNSTIEPGLTRILGR